MKCQCCQGKCLGECSPPYCLSCRQCVMHCKCKQPLYDTEFELAFLNGELKAIRHKEMRKLEREE